MSDTDEPMQPRLDARFNDVMLNIGANPAKPLDPAIAPVMIDGTPIEGLSYIKLEAGAGMITTITMQFHANVTGNITGKGVGDMLKERQQD